QSRFSILDHLRPTSRGRHLSPLLAARSDAGAERFEKELLDQRPAAHLSRTQQRLVAQLGARAAEYLRNLAQSDRSLPRQIAELNELVRNYGPETVAQAID